MVGERATEYRTASQSQPDAGPEITSVVHQDAQQYEHHDANGQETAPHQDQPHVRNEFRLIRRGLMRIDRGIAEDAADRVDNGERQFAIPFLNLQINSPSIVTRNLSDSVERIGLNGNDCAAAS